MKFKTFMELVQPNPMQPQQLGTERDKKVQEIWKKAFDALGVGGLSPDDAATNSLSKIQFGRKGTGSDIGDSGSGVFKGKQAVLKRLENGQIFSELEKLGDPELKKCIEDVRRWLGTEDSEHSSNASTTISELMKRLFGDKYFNSFIGKDFPKTDTAQAKVQPQPPKTDTPSPSMNQSTPQPAPPGPPMSGMMGQQPQAPGNMMPPAPTNPMPPQPAGAQMGLF